MNQPVDMMIHVSNPADKERLQAHIKELAGVVEARLRSDKANFMFISYDPEVFDIRTVPEIARSIGVHASIVGI